MPILLIISYPICVHAAVMSDIWWLHAVALTLLSLSVLYHGLRRAKLWALLTLPCCIGLSILLAWHDNALLALYLPPILLNAAAGTFFARSLLPGNTPLITNIAAQIRGDMPSAIARYTHQITWLWCILLYSLAVVNLLLAILAPAEWWSLFANFINYLLIGLGFIGEYIYRQLRYANYWHPSLRDFIKGMLNIDWRRI